MTVTARVTALISETARREYLIGNAGSSLSTFHRNFEKNPREKYANLELSR